MSAAETLRPAVRRIVDDLGDEDEDIATYAAMNVLRIREVTPEEIRALVPELRRTTSHESISVRFFSKKALNTVRHHMAKYPEFRAELESIRAETMGTSWIDLLAHLEEAETDKKLVVLDLLRDVPDPSLATATLEFTLREQDPFVLAEAVRVCGLVGDESHIGSLQKYLGHPDSRVRSNAAEALEEIGGKAVVKQILPLLDDEDNRVKATVAKLVAKYGEHNVLHALQDMLHSVELWMRESATYALGFVPYREAEELLLEALLDVNPEVQIKAISSLRALRSRRAKDYLETIVRQADGKLAEQAGAALAAISRDAQEYDYYDEANRHAESPLAARARQLRAQRQPGRPATGKQAAVQVDAEDLPEEEPKPQGFLARLKAKREEEKVLSMMREERELLEGELLQRRSELGRQVLEVYQGGEMDLAGMKELANDVKKIQYLIEMKESQKKEIEEEAQTTSFLDFIRESLLRFSREKQVESRVGSLHLRLMRKFGEIADLSIRAYGPDAVELMQFKELPKEIQRIRKRIQDIEEHTAAAEAAKVVETDAGQGSKSSGGSELVEDSTPPPPPPPAVEDDED